LSPIDCEQVLREIEFYLDGELEGPALLEIRQHLEMCGPCMDRSEFKRRLKELLSAKCGCDEVPPDLVAKVRAMLDEPPSATPDS